MGPREVVRRRENDDEKEINQSGSCCKQKSHAVKKVESKICQKY